MKVVCISVRCEILFLLELSFVHLGTITITGSQIREDRPVMGIRPSRPMQIDFTTSYDRRSVFLRISRINRADDVGTLDVATIYRSSVVVPSWPTDGALIGRPWGCCWVESRVIFTSNCPFVNVAVSCDCTDCSEDDAES